MCVHQITLYRQDRQPWGFRLHGGADFGTPLLIQLVKADSLSEAAGLQAGDILLSVSGQDVQLCRHKEAQDAIVRAGNKVNITIQRSGGMQQQQQQTVNPGSGTPTKGLMGGMGKQSGPAGPGADKWGHLLEANTAGQADSAEEFTRQFMSQLTGESASNLPPPLLNGTVVNGGSNQHPANDVSYTTPQYERIVTPTKQVASGQPDKVKTTRAMGQYNSPQAMYSEDNIQEILDQQAEVLSNGVKGINFVSDDYEANVAPPSETLKLVQELDTRQEDEPGPELDPSCVPSHYKGLANKNVQSYSFKMLQRALEGGRAGQDGEEGLGGDITLQNVHNVQAPKISDKDVSRGGSRVKSASPAPNYAHTPNTNSLPREKKIVQKITVRRTESPAPPSPALSPAPAKPTNTQNIQPARPSSSQGGGFQWPPQRQPDNGPTASPIYINPNSRNASPAPRTVTSSPSLTSPPRSLQSPAPTASRTVPVTVKPAPQVSSNNQWSETLNANSAGAANNAADFTKNFLSQLGTSQQVVTNSNGGTNGHSNMLHNPGPDPVPEGQNLGGAGQNVCAPRRGRGVLQQQKPGMRTPMCGGCQAQIRGPFITAMGKTWCPSHFLCSMEQCRQSLQDVGFVEEKGQLYCEDCYGRFLAPDCQKCRKKIIGNCLKAMSTTFHPECFACAYCNKIFANSPFYLEDGLPYCEEDWNELFTTKCISCGFPIEAGDRWVEALNNNYHSQCFNCSLCKENMEGKSFYAKGGRIFCKNHAVRH